MHRPTAPAHAFRPALAVCLIVCVPSATLLRADATPDWVSTGKQGMVASDSCYASQAGLEVLKAGGNATDAAAAVSFTLSVTRPQSTGLGGGGFMIIRRAADGRVVVLDYRETAPAAATRDMFRDSSAVNAGELPASRYGYLATCVPGVLAGQAEAVKEFGTLPLRRLLQPAIRLAERGFAADEHYAESVRAALVTYELHPELRKTCAYLYRRHLGNGTPPAIGDNVVQPELARLLRTIADHGPGVFYTGEVAVALARTMKAHGGRITPADLAAYRVMRREPVRSTYRGYELILMPPPSSGGLCIAETLNILDPFDLAELRREDHALATHYFIEALRHAFADRARWMGDPGFVDVPVGLLAGKTYAREISRTIQPRHTGDSAGYGSVVLPEDSGTSHFCVVDRWGNCVVATETINTSFGSYAAVDEWGLILNDEMDDFAARPGEPNAYGLIQSERNAVGPGRRPLSSMSPTMVLRDGKVVLLVGGSGGPRIITGVLNVMLNVIDGGQELPDALSAVRVHQQWMPETVHFDREPPATLAAHLRDRGHDVSPKPRTAAVQAISVQGDRLVGVSDPRKGGRPAGY